MRRYLADKAFVLTCRLIAYSTIFVLGLILFHIVKEGFNYLDWGFLDSFPSRKAERAGIKSALYGSLWLMGLVALFAIPIGIGSAIFFEEYAPESKLTRLLQINIANLAGMPSIVYGLLGLGIFVRLLSLDRSLVAGALTLTLLILPVIIIASQEAIRSVPLSIREAAFALGARKYQVVFLQVFPAAIPGIMTGVILAISRAMGESAPLIMMGALSYVAYVPQGPMDSFTVLPVQIFNWASRPQVEFHQVAASGIIVLLIALFTMNLIAALIRHRYQKYKVG